MSKHADSEPSTDPPTYDETEIRRLHARFCAVWVALAQQTGVEGEPPGWPEFQQEWTAITQDPDFEAQWRAMFDREPAEALADLGAVARDFVHRVFGKFQDQAPQ